MKKNGKLNNNFYIKKAGIIFVSIMFILSIFIPSISSSIEKNTNTKNILRSIGVKSNNVIFATDPPSFDGLFDNVYSTHGEHIYFGNVNYENFSGDLYVIDDDSIDPDYIWIAWIINPSFVDNTYGNGTVPQYVNKNGNPCGHSFDDLKESDRQEIKLYDTNSNLVFYARMDLIHSVASSPSGYGIPAWGDGDSVVYSGESSYVEYKTSTSFDINYYYDTPPINVLQDSPTYGDENYTIIPGYEEWEHKLIYELKVDRSLFSENTINVSDTEFLNIHASPNRIGPHTLPLYPIYNTIGDYVWYDDDKDGIQDSDEDGIDGVTVELYTCNDENIDSTITSNGGTYEFTSFPPGNYYIKFILPSNYVFTLQDQGNDDTIDSDADPTTGKTICTYIELGTLENEAYWDAGMYQQGEFTLTIYIEGGCGWVEKDPDLDLYPSGTEVQLTAYPNISAFEFDHWSGDLTGNNNPEYITMDSDKTVTAHFTFVEYTLTIIIDGNGHVIKDPDQDTYHFNDIVELTAVADPGWTFSYWSGDLSGSENPEYLQMYGDKTVTAHFTYHECILTINIDGNGDVIKDPDQNTFPDGTIVELTAVPDPGWKFDHWSDDLSGSNNPEFITMDDNKTVTAHFNIVDPPETPTISGSQELEPEKVYRYTFTTIDPNEYDVYYYVDWGDGTYEDWFGPYTSGKKVYLNHAWDETKIFTIKVKARNVFYAESEWGTLDVSVPRNKAINAPFQNFFQNLLQNHLQIFPILKILLQRLG